MRKMPGFPASPHPVAAPRLKSSRARRCLRCLVRWGSSAKDLEDYPAEAEVEQAYVGDHKQHKDHNYDEIIDQLLPGGVHDLAQLADRLPDELEGRRALGLDRPIALVRGSGFRSAGGTTCSGGLRLGARSRRDDTCWFQDLLR